LLVEPLGEVAASAAADARGFWGNLGQLLRDPEVATFFALCLVMGMGHGVLGSYLFIFLARLGERGGGGANPRHYCCLAVLCLTQPHSAVDTTCVPSGHGRRL
jgi:hypothetical protein